MKKDCKIVCDGKEIATLKHESEGISIKYTKDGKALCKEMCNCC